MAGIDHAHRAAEIVRDAGGQIVGRTKLQKIAFFLEAAGVGGGFPFRYKHFGPYSDQLAAATQHASALRLIREVEQVATWGGLYSTFYSPVTPGAAQNATRVQLAREMVNADAVELELAATAAYLSYEGYQDHGPRREGASPIRPMPDASTRRSNFTRVCAEFRRRILFPPYERRDLFHFSDLIGS